MNTRPLPKFVDPTGSEPAEPQKAEVAPLREKVESIVKTGLCSLQPIVDLLGMEGSQDLALRDMAHAVRRKSVGNRIHFRGIVELSNLCIKNCYYCGIRRENSEVERFSLSHEQILEAALWAHDHRYGSVVLQSGERTDERFVSFVEGVVRDIKRLSAGRLGVTLSMGEQTSETYARWLAAGAHRYLLRIETSSRDLYGKLHPSDHSFDARVRCLRDLRRLGYQVGTGVMIGLPGQSLQDLAADILFFRDLDVDMLGMGPYVLHDATPLAREVDNSEQGRARRLALALRMIAVARLAMPDINIASTTALQALHPLGREKGLMAGANIIMPIITPTEFRRHYQLYQGKPCVEDDAGQCQQCLERRIHSTGDVIAYSEWGDSPRALTRHPR
ncbi:MAG: [FeFe] hydrogenase H-cluster radical SAM maturase HydE [Polyangiaceae bacterium]